ncbi:MAG: N-acetylmuramoyl-L-alanine amidase family protein [Clostridium sp.]|uniref:N-acetylmuramoyl-L-alanine amidase family protein n=1 Tax=Clostridium sp. TaxID=1506 RepID=UPI003F2CD98B
MKKLTRIVAVVLVYICAITLIPNELATAAGNRQKKNKNIENGYVYYLSQYEDNFIMTYDSPMEEWRTVKKWGKEFSKEKNNFHQIQLHSRYLIEEGNIMDLKDFSISNVDDEIDKVETKLNEMYPGYDDIWVYISEINDGKRSFGFHANNYETGEEKRGAYKDGIIYENDMGYDFISIGDKFISTKVEETEETELWYLEVIDSDGVKQRVDIFETEFYGNDVTIDLLGNKIVIQNSYNTEIFRYKFENNKIVKLDQFSGTYLTVDKNGEVWGVKDKEVFKYENGSKVIKKKLEKEYERVFVYDENRIVVENASKRYMKVLYEDIDKGEWKSINGYYYYYENGVMQTGWKFIDGSYYYLNQDGTMQTGWLNLNGSWYYLDHNGRMAEGYKEVNGVRYFFDRSSGRMQNNGWTYDDKQARYRYCTESGELQVGWLYLNGYYYYLDKEYEGIMATGYTDVGEIGYFFDRESGVMQSNGWKYDEWYEEYRYCKENGEVVKGWLNLSGEYYYLNEYDGAMETGKLYLDHKEYFLNENGIMVTGWNWNEVDYWEAGYYYYAPNGELQKEWQWIEEAYYYLGVDGKMSTEWENINGEYYYLGSNGAMRTGWQWINNAYYYLGQSGAMRTEWQWIDNAYYYLGSDGAMRTGWQWIDDAYYYLAPGGEMSKGWNYIDNNWYYLYDNGKMATNTQIDGWEIGHNGIAIKVA